MRLLTNIVKNPGEDKYRQIKGTNAKIKATLFALDGAAALMPLMQFVELEPEQWTYVESDMKWISQIINRVEAALFPVRLQFMSPEEKEKALLLHQRQQEAA